MDRVAVEVIREYGANELVGKIYTKGTANQWIPLDPSKEGEVEWFSWYKKFPPGVRNNAKMYYFDMEDLVVGLSCTFATKATNQALMWQ